MMLNPLLLGAALLSLCKARLRGIRSTVRDGLVSISAELAWARARTSSKSQISRSVSAFLTSLAVMAPLPPRWRMSFGKEIATDMWVGLTPRTRLGSVPALGP